MCSSPFSSPWGVVFRDPRSRAGLASRFRGSLLRRIALASALVAGCGKAGPPGADGGRLDAGSGPHDAAVDGGGDAGPVGLDGSAGTGRPDAAVYDSDAVFLAMCQDYSSLCSGPRVDANCGTCQYRVAYRPDVCSAAHPCDDLLVYWTPLGCERDNVERFLKGLLDAYPDLIATCVQPIYPGEPLPSSIGAPERDRLVVRTLLQRLKPGGDLGVWSGRNVLHGGCSIGATRFPVVVARFDVEGDLAGRAKTAACLSDGVLNVQHQLDYVSAGTGASCRGRARRIRQRYAMSYPSDCGGGDCESFDSILRPDGTGGFVLAPGLSPASFGIANWKLVTEGSAFSDPAERCDKDVVEGTPFHALCAILEADPAHHCVEQAFPDAKHCASYTSTFGTTCIDWFRAL